MGHDTLEEATESTTMLRQSYRSKVLNATATAGTAAVVNACAPRRPRSVRIVTLGCRVACPALSKPGRRMLLCDGKDAILLIVPSCQSPNAVTAHSRLVPSTVIIHARMLGKECPNFLVWEFQGNRAPSMCRCNRFAEDHVARKQKGDSRACGLLKD